MASDGIVSVAHRYIVNLSKCHLAHNQASQEKTVDEFFSILKKSINLLSFLTGVERLQHCTCDLNIVVLNCLRSHSHPYWS